MINKPEELRNITEQKNFIFTLKEMEKNFLTISTTLDNINNSIKKLNTNFDELLNNDKNKEECISLNFIDNKINNMYNLIKDIKNNEITENKDTLKRNNILIEEIKEDCFKNKEPINIYMKNGTIIKNVLLYRNKSIDSLLTIGEILDIIKLNKNEVLIFASENIQGTLITCIIDKIELSGQSL